jgi:hypothetical protein
VAREPLIILIVALSMISGMFSPFRDQAFIMMVALAPGFFIGSPSLILYLTMLFVSALTIMLGGVTCALFERVTGRQNTDNVSLAIWAVAVAVIAWPGVEALMRLS